MGGIKIDIIKCALIGLGRIGSTLEQDKYREKPCTHAGAIQTNQDCKLVGACDIDIKKQKTFSKQWGCKELFKNPEIMMKKTTPDIVFIATHPETHKDILFTAIRNNVPVVICEKPLSDNVKDSKLMLNAIRNSKTKCIINHERRFSLDYIHVKKIIKSGIYGKLLSISGQLYMGNKRKPEKLIWHDGTHMLDIINYLTEDELCFVGKSGNAAKDSEETLVIQLKSNNIPITIQAGNSRNYIFFELDLSFSKGRIRIGNGLYEEYISEQSPYYEKMRSLTLNNNIKFEKTEYFSNMLKEAVQLVKQEKLISISDIVYGYESVKLINQILS